MKVYDDISLRNFQPWSGAVDNFNSLSYEELDQIEATLEELYPDGISETTINDLFWFDFETICEWLGIKTEYEIKDEIEEKQAEIDSLMDDYKSDIEDMEESEIKDYFAEYYKDDIDILKDEIEELKEELKRWEE
jgi:gas vesicle protein